MTSISLGLIYSVLLRSYLHYFTSHHYYLLVCRKIYQRIQILFNLVSIFCVPWIQHIIIGCHFMILNVPKTPSRGRDGVLTYMRHRTRKRLRTCQVCTWDRVQMHLGLQWTCDLYSTGCLENRVCYSSSPFCPEVVLLSHNPPVQRRWWWLRGGMNLKSQWYSRQKLTPPLVFCSQFDFAFHRTGRPLEDILPFFTQNMQRTSCD